MIEIRFDNVKKSFTREDGTVINALNGVNLEINHGDFISLIGASGYGKPTLLRLLAGFDSPTERKVFLGNEEIKKPSYDRGLVFQEHNLFSWLSIRFKSTSYLQREEKYG